MKANLCYCLNSFVRDCRSIHVTPFSQIKLSLDKFSNRSWFLNKILNPMGNDLSCKTYD